MTSAQRRQSGAHDKLSDISDKLYELQGRLMALECFTGVLRDVKTREGMNSLAEAFLTRTEAARVALLNQPVPDRVLSVFDLEVERLLARLHRDGS